MHIPVEQTIILPGNLIFTFQRPYSWQSEEGGWSSGYSTALVCPVCLDVWAKMPVAGRGEFVIIGHPCEKHPINRYGVAGSIFPGVYRIHDSGLWEELPDELLKREFLLAEKHYDRYFSTK